MAETNPSTVQTETFTATNPSGMTLSGTNTYLIAAPQSQSVVIVDPGEQFTEVEHAEVLAEALGTRRVELILITHRHHDHTGALEYFHRFFNTAVRAYESEFCRDARPLVAGEVIAAAGTQIHAIHTPGHTSDSFSFYLPDDAPHDGVDSGGSILTGDTILGEGTTMLDYPDGSLSDYLSSLGTIEALESDEPLRILPAHGPQHSSARPVVDYYASHRLQRVQQMREMAGGVENILRPVVASSYQVSDLTHKLYPELPDGVQGAAQRTVAATLHYILDTADTRPA